MTVEETLSVVDGFKALNVSSMTSVEKAAITLAAEVRRLREALSEAKRRGGEVFCNNYNEVFCGGLNCFECKDRDFVLRQPLSEPPNG